MLGVFYKDTSEYLTQLNPVKGYLDQLSFYIAKKKNISLEEAREKASSILKTHFKDKEIKHFEREENGDRVLKDSTLYAYIKSNIQNKNILVPTFTSYINTKTKKSILSEFIFINVKKRSIAKKAGQKAKAEGKIELADAKNNEQNMMKIYNNALSGVFGQEACILHNPTAHNTLTSITRTVTSIGNANNERLIAGNRYLPRGKDVLTSIIYTTTYTNIAKVKEVVDKYGMYIPTVEDTVNVLKYSSDLYFKDDVFYKEKVIPFLEKLDVYYLCSICYTGDLYHIRKFNDGLIRGILGELITKVSDGSKLENINVIGSLDESIVYLAHSIFFNDIKGYGKDYDKMNEAGIASGIYNTSLHIGKVLEKYKDFFNVFFMNEVFPSNSFRLKNMRRRTVVLSDTDSTCFTLDDWVKWYKGKFYIDEESIALAGCLSYITSQTIVNTLAILSSNMNIDKEFLNTLAMKNEFLWTVHAPCEVSKHYFAYTVTQEGNVFKEPDIEKKGVHLKNSAVPHEIIQHSNKLIEYILKTVTNNNKIKLNYVISEIINLEKDIISSVLKGESKYLKKSKIKDKEAYALDEMKSPYQRHVFWKDVFSSKYGEIPDPPYDVVKLPTTIKSNVLLNSWIENIEDIELKDRLVDWLKRYNKKDLPTVYLNDNYILGNSVPKELIDIINIKQIVFDITMQHRIILGTLGVMINEEKLISEQFNL